MSTPAITPTDFTASVIWDGSNWVPTSEITSNPIAAFTSTVTTSAQQAPNGKVTKGVTLTAGAANAAVVYVGGAGVTASTGYPLAAGVSLHLPVANANQIYFVGTAADKLSGIGL